MYQGVIRLLKVTYLSVNYSKCREEKNLPKISLLQEMHMLVTAWDARPTKAIVNCFRKSGIFIETQETTIA